MELKWAAMIVINMVHVEKRRMEKPGKENSAYIIYIYTLYTLRLFNIAMENGPFIDGLPIKHSDFPWLC